jgi:hypothetical protein
MSTLVEREVCCFFSSRLTPLAKGSLYQSCVVTVGPAKRRNITDIVIILWRRLCDSGK